MVVSEGGLNENSALAFVLLESLGQAKVSIFLDSVERWAELGQTVTRPAAADKAVAPAPTQAVPYAAPVAAARQFEDRAGPPGLYPKVYVAAGERLPTKPPPGRMIHLPYSQFINADGTPKAAKEIWALLAKAGVPRYAELVLVADTPGEAAVDYVVFRLMGLADLKLWAP